MDLKMSNRTVSRRDHAYYIRAERLCRLSTYSIRVGAFAAHNGKALAGAFNTVRNVPKPGTYGGATYHAEFNCIRMVPPRLLSRITLYVARINKMGEKMPSCPCDRCLHFLYNNDVREICYFNGSVLVKERL